MTKVDWANIISLNAFDKFCDYLQSFHNWKDSIRDQVSVISIVPQFDYVLTTDTDSFSCQHEKLFSVVWIQIAQNWNKFFTHTEHRSEAVDRGDLDLTPERSLPSQWIPVLAPTYSLPQRSKYLFKQVWHRTYSICDALFLRTARSGQLRSVTEIAPKSLILCVISVNKSLLQHGFVLSGTYSVNSLRLLFC